MKTREKIICLALLIAALSACDGGKQGTSSGNPAPQAKIIEAPPPPPPPPPHVPVDLKLTTLDQASGQFGHDVRKIVPALMGLDLEQGPYESDGKFGSRLKAMGSTELYDQLKVDSLLAFNLQGVRFNYDANKAQWEYEVSPHSMNRESNVYSVTSWPVGDAAQWAPHFPGKRLEQWVTLAVELPELKGVNYIRGAYPVAAEEAPQFDNGLDVLLIGKLVPNYFRSDQVLPVGANSGNKVDTVRMMKVKTSGVWLVNRRTGEVVSKKWTIRKL